MRTSLFIAQAAATLLVLVGTGPALLAQNGAIQLTLKGGWASASEPVRKVQVVGPYAYLVVGETGLQVLDVSSPTNPVPLARYDASQRINGFHVAGHHAYLATGSSNPQTNNSGVLEVLDMSHPTNLVLLSQTETHEPANAVYAMGDVAYVAEGSWWSQSNRVGALEILSVTNPSIPIVMGRYDASGPVNDIKVAEGYAYLAGGGAALCILNVSDSRSPVSVGEFRTNSVFGSTIDVIDGYACLSSGFAGFFILDIMDPSHPTLVRQLVPAIDQGVNVSYSVKVADHFAFVSLYYRRGRNGPWIYLDRIVFDLSDPTEWENPLGQSYEPVSLLDLKLAGGHAYMAVETGLLVYEFTELPYFRSIVRTADKIVLSWNNLPRLTLQSTPSLTIPDWRDVPGSVGTNRMQLPLGGGHAFFRLVQPATP